MKTPENRQPIRLPALKHDTRTLHSILVNQITALKKRLALTVLIGMSLGLANHGYAGLVTYTLTNPGTTARFNGVVQFTGELTLKITTDTTAVDQDPDNNRAGFAANAWLTAPSLGLSNELVLGDTYLGIFSANSSNNWIYLQMGPSLAERTGHIGGLGTFNFYHWTNVNDFSTYTVPFGPATGNPGTRRGIVTDNNGGAAIMFANGDYFDAGQATSSSFGWTVSSDFGANVPEPTTFLLFGGAVGSCLLRRRRC